MKALIAIISWVTGLFGSPEAPVQQAQANDHRGTITDGRGVHIVGTNPRTVVALEDTHFRPNR